MDVEAVLRQVDLVSLAESAGARFNGKLSAACPLHGGNNPSAFHVYTGPDGRQRWRCFTNCPEGQNGGDAAAFWMAWKKVDFRTAVEELAAWAKVPLTEPEARRREVLGMALQAPAAAPGAEWMARAGVFADWAAETLWAEAGVAGQRYLAQRGLTEATWKAARLGWNPKVLQDRPERWGFQARENPVWLHAGVTIPHVTPEGLVQAVKVRCFSGGQAEKAGGKKYRGPRGGRMALYGQERWAGLPVLLLVEGEFDALLAWQEAGDLVDVATLAGAKANLDTGDALALLGKAVIVAVYDADEAGQTGGAAVTARWPRAKQAQPPDHDLTDYWVHGGNLRAWIAALAAGEYEALLERAGKGEAFVKWLAVYERCLGGGA